VVTERGHDRAFSLLGHFIQRITDGDLKSTDFKYLPGSRRPSVRTPTSAQRAEVGTAEVGDRRLLYDDVYCGSQTVYHPSPTTKLPEDDGKWSPTLSTLCFSSFIKESGEVPGMAYLARKAVLGWFEQALVETVMGCPGIDQ
jgi:hypothetical protein